MNAYTGISSRSTPAFIETVMVAFADRLQLAGWVLRSGHSDGDKAFEWGAGGEGAIDTEVYVPWPGFNGSAFGNTPQLAAYTIAKAKIPWWAKMNSIDKELAARAVHQLLGHNLDTASRFLICWTPDGATGMDDTSNETGGALLAITLASQLDIPIFNMAVKEHAEYLYRFAGITVPQIQTEW